MNILKHSARSFLQVIEGSNRMRPPVLLASWFLSFLEGVRDRLSWVSPISRGLSLGAMRCMQDCAAVAQAWGFLQPSVRSCVQSVHGHWGFGICGKSCLVSRRQADVEIKSATVDVSCFRSRHLAVVVVMGVALACGWYHAGS